MSKYYRVSEITWSREYHRSFQGTNVRHIGPLTEKWRETASLLENTEMLFELHTDVRANKLMFYHSKRLKTPQSQFLNKSKENNTDAISRISLHLKVL